MANKSTSATINPAVLRYRGQNHEAMTAMQMRNLDAMRRMINLMFDSTQSITERQTEFFKTSVDQMNGAYKEKNVAADPKIIFEQQAATYKELSGLLASHVAGLTSEVSKCCAKMANEAVEAIGEQPDGNNEKSCCTHVDDATQKNKPAKK